MECLPLISPPFVTNRYRRRNPAETAAASYGAAGLSFVVVDNDCRRQAFRCIHTLGQPLALRTAPQLAGEPVAGLPAGGVRAYRGCDQAKPGARP
jgi:hypothetical protein